MKVGLSVIRMAIIYTCVNRTNLRDYLKNVGVSGVSSYSGIASMHQTTNSIY